MQKACVAFISLLSRKGLSIGVQGFVATSRLWRPAKLFRPADSRIWASTIDILNDGEAERKISQKNLHPLDEPFVPSAYGDFGGGRYDDLIVDLGLEGKLKQIGRLPSKRKVSPYDVFCNRELKQSKLAAVGFDMDYTLCQYKQPAFDKLAFDGAKEKLVYKLGYPKEVLDFEYDHEVILEQIVMSHALKWVEWRFSFCHFSDFVALDERLDYRQGKRKFLEN